MMRNPKFVNCLSSDPSIYIIIGLFKIKIKYNFYAPPSYPNSSVIHFHVILFLLVNTILSPCAFSQVC